MKLKRKTLKEWCEGDLEQREYLLNEWDYEKNKDITPNEISYGSANKVWWRCSNGHEYDATPNHRTRGMSCPYCKGKKVLTGYNDLVSQFPHIAEEWNYEKNAMLSPKSIAPGSNKKVWWRCQTCGNEWETTINHRTAKTRATGCPKCCERERAKQHMQANVGTDDFASTHPELVNEWDYDKNSPLTPENIKAYSNQKYYWICPMGHSYKATAGHRSCGRGCPICTGKLVIRGINDIATTHPELVKDWDYEGNGNITPFNISHGSKKKINWKCHGCGYKWKTALYCRASGTGCPKCNKEVRTSFPEQAVYYYIKQAFPDAINTDTKAIGLELDVYIPSEKIALEYDGVRWHSDAKRQTVEKAKNELCRKNNILLIRIREDGLEEYEDCAVCIPIKGRHSNLELSKAITDTLHTISNDILPDVNVDRDAADIYSQYISREKSLSLQNIYPEIASEWDREKNGTITPDKIRAMSNKKFWWKCKLGHEYYMSVNDRTGSKNAGCPYCSGRKVLKGFNDLAFKYPDTAAEWNYQRNGVLTPEHVTSKSNRKVWWKCSKCGKEFESMICSRIRGNKGTTGCKECNQKAAALIWTTAETGVDDLETLNPEIAREWDYERNGTLTPKAVKAHSNRKIWWKCSKCGNCWQATVNTRMGGCGCPYCAGKRATVGKNDLATKAPGKAKLWDYEANHLLKPEDVTTGSHKIVNWKCEKGHTWRRSVKAEIKSLGCPFCVSM